MKIKRKCIRSKVQIRAPQFRLIIQNDLKVGKIKQLMLILHTHTKNKVYRVLRVKWNNQKLSGGIINCSTSGMHFSIIIRFII